MSSLVAAENNTARAEMFSGSFMDIVLLNNFIFPKNLLSFPNICLDFCITCEISGSFMRKIILGSHPCPMVWNGGWVWNLEEWPRKRIFLITIFVYMQSDIKCWNVQVSIFWSLNENSCHINKMKFSILSRLNLPEMDKQTNDTRTSMDYVPDIVKLSVGGSKIFL